MKNKIKKILIYLIYFFIVFIAVVFILAVFEIFNYLNISKVNYSYVWPPNLRYVFSPNSSIFHRISGESLFTINSLGYRGVEFKNHENEYRVLIIGGSTSECLYLDDKEAWPYILMNKLKKTNDNKKVITMNIGKSGHGIRNNILELKYLPENYEPDMIIMMTGANDVLFRLSRKDEWQPFNESEFDSKDSYTFSLSPGYTWKSTITYKIYRFAELKFNKPKPQDAIGYTLAENRLKRKNAKNWINEKPDLNQSLEDYERNLKRIISLSKENNITLIFSTQPYLWKKNMTEEEDASLWMTNDFGDNYYPVETMIYSIDAFNQKLLEVCESNKDIFCIDLDKDTPKTPDYFYDDMHFNENGASFVAEKLSSYIKENLPGFK
ncbi:SGNH/GDSL hydrolase family protein [Candidatus Pacearchaeota archaeon]|nr:SGNH/GDSL hydrolase family protein [Candidatus Pacearchaeota archaeon]